MATKANCVAHWALLLLTSLVGGGCVTGHMWERAGEKVGYPEPLGVLGPAGNARPDYVVFEYLVVSDQMLGRQDFLYLIPTSPVAAGATAPTPQPAHAGKVVSAKDAPRVLQSPDFHRLDADRPFTRPLEGTADGGIEHFVVRRDGHTWDVFAPSQLPRPDAEIAGAHARAAALTPVTLALDCVVNPVCLLVYLPLHFTGLVESWNPPWPVYYK